MIKPKTATHKGLLPPDLTENEIVAVQLIVNMKNKSLEVRSVAAEETTKSLLQWAINTIQA